MQVKKMWNDPVDLKAANTESRFAATDRGCPSVCAMFTPVNAANVGAMSAGVHRARIFSTRGMAAPIRKIGTC